MTLPGLLPAASATPPRPRPTDPHRPKTLLPQLPSPPRDPAGRRHNPAADPATMRAARDFSRCPATTLPPLCHHYPHCATATAAAHHYPLCATATATSALPPLPPLCLRCTTATPPPLPPPPPTPRAPRVTTTTPRPTPLPMLYNSIFFLPSEDQHFDWTSLTRNTCVLNLSDD